MSKYEPHIVIGLQRARKIIEKDGLTNKKELNLLIDDIDKLVISHKGIWGVEWNKQDMMIMYLGTLQKKV